MASNSPLRAEVQRVVHAVLEAGWAQVRSCIISRCGGCSADGGSAETGGATRASLWRTSDQKALRLCQILHLVHDTLKTERKYCKKKKKALKEAQYRAPRQHRALAEDWDSIHISGNSGNNASGEKMQRKPLASMHHCHTCNIVRF